MNQTAKDMTNTQIRTWVRHEKDTSTGDRKEFCTNVLAYFILMSDKRETRDWKALLAVYASKNSDKYPDICKRLLSDLMSVEQESTNG